MAYRNSQYPELNDYDWLYQRYVVEKRTITEIAAMVKPLVEGQPCHWQAVKRALRRFEILPPAGPRKRFPELDNPVLLRQMVQTMTIRAMAEKIGCKPSGVYHALQRFHIPVPGRETRKPSPNRSANVKKTLKERYPDGRRGPLAGNWKGGRHPTPAGYIRVYAPDHPRAKANVSDYVFEHILVMEKKLGRYLKPGEVVDHYPDETKSNNHPDNLVLRSSNGEHRKAHHEKGKRVAEVEAENAELRAEIERLRKGGSGD